MDGKDNTLEENKCIIMAVANLILNAARYLKVSSEYHPIIQEIQSGTVFLPPLLKYFIKCLVSSELKHAADGQCLMKSMRQNTILPLFLFGFSIENDHA